MYHLKLYPHERKTLFYEDNVFRGLWIEGLATYISFVLNPKVSYTELLLDIPRNLVPDTDKNLSIIAKDLLHNLHSSEPKIYDKYFLLNIESEFPNRCGYYIGLLVLKEMSKKYTLDQLIRLREKEFIPELATQLEIFSKGS